MAKKAFPVRIFLIFLQIFAIIWKCPKVWNYLSKTENSCIYFECHILCVIQEFFPLCDASHQIHFCTTLAMWHLDFFFLNDIYYVTYHRLICDVVIGCPIIYNLSESCSVKLIEESAYAIKWYSKYQFHSGSWLSNHHVYHIYVYVYHIYVRWIIMYIIYMFAD